MRNLGYKHTEQLKTVASGIRHYLSAPPAVQEVIRDMIEVAEDSSSSEEDVNAALVTMEDALWPRAPSDLEEMR